MVHFAFTPLKKPQSKEVAPWLTTLHFSVRPSYLLMVILPEAKSPSVSIKEFDELLLARGFELEWIPSSSLVRRILGEVSTLCILTGYYG